MLLLFSAIFMRFFRHYFDAFHYFRLSEVHIDPATTGGESLPRCRRRGAASRRRQPPAAAAQVQ